MSPEVVEVTFKRNRKGYFFNSNDIELRLNDYAIVEVDKGEDMGQITQTGRLVMLKDIKNEPGNIVRKAGPEDNDKLLDNRRNETSAFNIGKEYIQRRNLNMKLVDVEYLVSVENNYAVHRLCKIFHRFRLRMPRIKTFR
jgi:cell fate regulator YaaT (PSP1 superfamily)